MIGIEGVDFLLVSYYTIIIIKQSFSLFIWHYWFEKILNSWWPSSNHVGFQEAPKIDQDVLVWSVSYQVLSRISNSRAARCLQAKFLVLNWIIFYFITVRILWFIWIIQIGWLRSGEIGWLVQIGMAGSLIRISFVSLILPVFRTKQSSSHSRHS